MIKNVLTSCSNHTSETSEAMIYCVKCVFAGVKEQNLLQRLIYADLMNFLISLLCVLDNLRAVNE